jgi:hypothetical protein
VSIILLDGEYYDVTGNIIRRNINPRAARFETGIPGYSSFTQASVEAWKGMRGGIGHKYQESSGTEECYWSEGLDGSHDAGIILGPYVNSAGSFTVAPVKIIDFTDSTLAKYTYCIGTSKIARSNADTPSWTTVDSSLASPIDAIVVTDSTATYLVVSSATAAIYTSNGTSWSTLTGCMGYLAFHDNKLYGFSGHTIYYSPAKDIDGTWSTCDVTAYLGTVYGLFTAKSQATDEPLLCLHTSKGLWTIDPWVQEIYPYLELPGHTYSGMAGMFWNSYIYVSTGSGIKRIAGGIVTDIGPDQDDGLPNGYQGYISDMIGMADGSWMVYSVSKNSSSDKSSIIKRHGTVGGNQQIYTSAADTAITCLCYSPSNLYTNGRLWWGEGTNIKYCMMPDFNTDVTEISGYTYVSPSGKMIYPIFRPLEGFTKTAISVAAITKGCDTGKYFTVYYWSDNDSDWQTLGTFKTSPQPTALSFPVGDDAGEGLEFRWMKLAVMGQTNSSTSTPELRSLELDYDVGTKRLRGWTFVIKVYQDNSEAIIDSLHTIQDKNTLVLFYPSGDSVNGDSYRVKIENIDENVTWDASREVGTLQVSVGELLRR